MKKMDIITSKQTPLLGKQCFQLFHQLDQYFFFLKDIKFKKSKPFV